MEWVWRRQQVAGMCGQRELTAFGRWDGRSSSIQEQEQQHRGSSSMQPVQNAAQQTGQQATQTTRLPQHIGGCEFVQDYYHIEVHYVLL